MNKDRSNTEELQYSERFSRGVRTGRDEKEREAFQGYEFLRTQITSYTPPKINRAVLSQRLAEEMRRPAWFYSCRFLLGRLPKPAFAAVCIVCVSLALKTLFSFHPVTSVELIPESPAGKETISFWWKHRLERGRAVTVPEGAIGEIYLSDGSAISCTPGTQIAISLEDDRLVTLNSGEIVVHAARIPHSSLVVQTPLGDVRVVGTVFRVKVRR